MTRNNSAELTRRTREQYETLRGQMHRTLAQQVLDTVGVRTFGGRPYITTFDLHAHEDELLTLLGQVRAWYTATERQRLYKNNQHLGVSLAKLVLGSVGHPLERSPCRIDPDTTSCKFSLLYKFNEKVYYN
jgi:hypothetical protein